jgi:hypothetical protein
VRLETETAKVRVAGGDTTEARPSLAGELAGLEPAPFGVGAKGLDDAVELAGGSQLAHLAEARQRAVGVLAVLPHGLDEREVLIGFVAPPPDRLLYKDMSVLQHCNSAV